MSKIVIIDYGMGNLRSVQKGFEKVGWKAIISNNPKIIKNSSGFVLPGVGAFDAAVKHLNKFKLFNLIKQQIKSGQPFLGICLGYQLLFEKSEEGKLSGLGVFEGKVKKFPARGGCALGAKGKGLKIPQIGWNQVKLKILPTKVGISLRLKKAKLKMFEGIPDNSYFYFVHSYYAIPKDKSIIAGVTHYGKNYASAIEKGNIWGVQFHPEKSSRLGLKILKNFGELCLK